MKACEGPANCEGTGYNDHGALINNQNIQGERMVASAEQLHHEETKTRSNWCPIEKSVSSWKSVDVYNLQRPRITDQQFGSSEDLFLDHCSLAIDRSSDAFGIKIAGSGTTPNQILYSGEYLDLGTGNYALRNRIYRQNTGTFLTADTTPSQLPYVYTSSNPVMFADPSGRFGITSTLSAISLTSFLAGSVGAAFGGAEHGLRGVEAGFLGGFAGTAITLGSFATIEFVAPWLAPVAAPIAFGLGGFVDTLVQDVTLGGLKALDERSTWEGAIASFVVSGAFGWAGGATLYYINREVAADFAALPSVWNVLGKIQNNAFAAVYPSVLETGLQQTLGTMFRFYMPELFALGRDLVMDEAGSGFRNTAIVPIAQFLVNFAYVSFEGQPPTGSTVSG